MLIQRILLGLEARIPTLVLLELGCRHRLTRELIDQVSDPFSLKRGAGTAAIYYNVLPALVEPQFALSVSDPELWELVRSFYRNIRNKIFHGAFITDLTAAKMDYIFLEFDRVYEWTDRWCNLQDRMNEVLAGQHNFPQPSRKD